MGHDIHGPLLAYRACSPLLSGLCPISRQQRDCCEKCEALAGVRLPEQLPRCRVCGGAWSLDPVSRLRFCAVCEAGVAKYLADRQARKNARRHQEAAQDALVQTAMSFVASS